MARSIAALLAILWAGVLGCRDDAVYKQILGFQEPVGAKASTHPELLALVSQVEASGGLASQLDGVLGPESDNLAAALSNLYSEDLHAELAEPIAAIATPGSDSAARAAILSDQALLLRRTIEAVDLPRCRWNVEHRIGYFSVMRYLDDATTAVHLLLAAAIQSAEQDEADAAPHVLRALRVAHELSKVQRVGARVQAGTLRAETLNVINALMRAGIFGKAEAEQVYEALRDALTDWPPDRRMLFGERAAVIHAYEAIRAGMLNRLLTLEERRRLRDANALDAMNEATAEMIDDDQAAYLVAMSRLIADADRPYAEQLASLEETLSEARRGSVFAKHMFLVDLADALRLAASDRARCEAWTIALASVAELQPPPFRVDPSSGLPYEVTESPSGVAVALGIAGENVIAVPRLSR